AFMLLMLAATASAATIYGTIYDYSLDKAKDARVEINTEPKQIYISKNGSYAFNVPNGEYAIEAKQYIGSLLKASASENITIKDNGAYVLDLVLFPAIGEGELEEDIDINDPFEERKLNTAIILASIIIIILLFAAYYAKSKSTAKAKDKKPEDYDLEKVIKVLKEEGGRATQKAIRKEIPLSEAKISLMIAELEHKGVVEKIKKGRGNIIILKR
ncbi:MAG: hypothetical protein AABX74_02830, partial [Nanoarchaeota archaeon]